MLCFHSSVNCWFLFVVLLMVQTPVLRFRFGLDPSSDPARGRRGLQLERDGRVRCCCMIAPRHAQTRLTSGLAANAPARREVLLARGQSAQARPGLSPDCLTSSSVAHAPQPSPVVR
jgi:hypothetical protein